jgi:uncharacterized protein (TIGR03435 family)
MTRLLVLCSFACTLSAQSFDVVSVKEITDPAALKAIQSADIQYKSGNLYMRGSTLALAIEWAYDIHRYQIAGPEWMYWRSGNDQPRFDIIAKAPASTPKEQARVMLQAVLAERFGLKVRWETRQASGYVLRDDPQGLKIEFAATTDGDPSSMKYDVASGKLQFSRTTIDEMCGELSLSIGEPVVDATSLGTRIFSAGATVAKYRSKDEMINAILGGIKRDMGITSTYEKVPVKTLVVDQVNRRPSVN